MKHVVFDARSAFPFQQRDGLGTYICEVVPRVVKSAEDFRSSILTNPHMLEFWKTVAPQATLVPSDCRPMWPGQNWYVPRLLRTLRPHLYFYPVHDPPILDRTPLVFTIHDLISHQVRPYFEKMDALKMAYIRSITAVALRRARRVLTGSEATKIAVGQIFGERYLEKIRVTPYGFNEPLLPSVNSGKDDSCLLYVGTDRPHKNLDRLILAYAIARTRTKQLPRLEIVGGLRDEKRVREQIKHAKLNGHVLIRGYVTDEELETVYRRAVALVFPSLAEGFGFPILEAMCRSLPVVTSNRSACAEVAGEAGLLVDPYDVESIAAGIVRITEDTSLRDKFGNLGKTRAASFSWEQCAAGTLNTIREALELS
jgi:glycosyltransferase involved in cell wall biosynthesis